LHAGSGPPLILVHGLLGYAFSWRFVLPALAPHATVYALDMPGAGFSDRCAGMNCSFRGCANRLLHFAEQLGLTSFDLLGTSHGGAVAMTAAGLARESGSLSIRRLILVAPVNPFSSHGRGLAKFLSGRIASLIFRKTAPHGSLIHDRVLRRLYGDTRKIRPGTLEGYVRPLKLPGSFEYGLRILSTWNEDLRELENALCKISGIPTLMVWGSLDRAVDPTSAHTLCRYFRQCRVIEMKGVGHLPYEEAPDEFNRIVLEFLTDPGVSPQ
jgi:pimeloyl-ACP methyl ester carboxylesterase